MAQTLVHFDLKKIEIVLETKDVFTVNFPFLLVKFKLADNWKKKRRLIKIRSCLASMTIKSMDLRSRYLPSNRNLLISLRICSMLSAGKTKKIISLYESETTSLGILRGEQSSNKNVSQVKKRVNKQAKVVVRVRLAPGNALTTP